MINEYYAGKGCTCYAYSEGECCCDVDWTDPKIYDQQATIVKLVEALDAVCDLALMPDHECPDDIQPVVSGYKDLINSVKDQRVKEGDDGVNPR